jgi:tetratricopeptide (TPR) repeat protein
MLRRWCVHLLALLCVFSTAYARSSSGHAQKSAVTKLPVTTSSAEARKDFDRAMADFEEYRLRDCLQNLRAAAKADPNFAQSLILISRLTGDPAEQAETRKRAQDLAPKVSPGEQMLIRWLADAQENNYLPAIATMNDLLAKYPQDPRVAFLAGDWLNGQQRYEQSVVVLERAVTLYPKDAAALNDLAYAYAYLGNFEKAFAAMDRYVALEPEEPNPHDSYGEILRMAGKFDAALAQYRTSIRLDVNFGSEIGVADTYALMGKEQDARDEYERAIVFASSDHDKIMYQLRSSLTWIREDNRKQAEKSLGEVARSAHEAGLAKFEAEAHRMLALYEPDPKAALKHVQVAESVLKEGHPISAADRDEEMARVLRVRATLLAEAQDLQSATGVVSQLEEMASSGRSEIIQLSWEGAAGAVLFAQDQYADAIPGLEDDASNPLSMKLLWRCYSATGAQSQAQALASRLASFNFPTVEQALVVPQFRTSQVSQAQQPQGDGH